MSQFFSILISSLWLMGCTKTVNSFDNNSPINIRNCHLVSSEMNFMNGHLSDYWAQEIIGSDLLKEKLEEVPNPFQKNGITVFDAESIFDSTPDYIKGAYRRHAILVKNLISSNGRHSILPEMKTEKIPIFLVNAYNYYHIDRHNGKRYLQFANILKKQPPAFINNSMHWSNEQIIYKAFHKLSPPTVLITVSGNYFPKKINHIKIKASKNLNTIIVGNFSQNGMVSDFSQEGEEVFILAPSGDFLITTDRDEKYKIFGGTSGAASLVTGSLAGFEWLSDYHPLPEEAKILLKKTAIPTIHSHENPQKNGVGLLNSYKLGMVGKILNKKCKNKGDFCFKQNIRGEAIYHFQQDEDLLQDLYNTFPMCFLKGENELESEKSCDEKDRVLKKLRQTVLLQPKRKELWNILSCIYKEGGFLQNGEILDNIALSIEPKENIINVLRSYIKPEKIKDEHSLSRQIRLIVVASRIVGIKESIESLSILGENVFSEDKSSNIFSMTNTDVWERVAGAAGALGGIEGFQLLNTLVNDPSEIVKKAVAEAAGALGGIEGFQLLNTLVNDPSEIIKKAVAEAAGALGGIEGFQLLNTLVNDPSETVKEAVAEAAGVLGGIEGFQLLNTLVNDPSAFVKAEVADAAGVLGSIEGFQLLNTLVNDPSVAVKSAMVKAAGTLGSIEGFQLLNTLVNDPNVAVKNAMVKAAGRLGGKDGIFLLKALLSNINTDNTLYYSNEHFLLGRIAYELSEIGGKEEHQIMHTIFQNPVFQLDPSQQYVKNSILYYLRQ